MLSPNDFAEKQILFIKNWQIKENKIRLHNQNIEFLEDEKIKNKLSCHKILAVFILGDCSVSTVLIRNCMEYGISLFLLKNNMQVYGALEAKAEGNYFLRQKQYSFQDEFGFSKKLMENKIRNQLALLKSAKKIDSKEYKKRKKDIFARVKKAGDINTLMGIEGSVARYFFQLYFSDLDWQRRMPRAKLDEYNILLDIGYSFLFNYIDCLLRLYGFDTYKGIYHQLFFQRKSLSCDIMEPFRCIIEKTLLKMHNLGQIDQKDFKRKGVGYVLKYDKSGKYAKIFLEEITVRKKDIFNYIRDFYYCVLRDSKEYPKFNIR